MGTKITPPGFQKITRRDNIFQEHDHDAYKFYGRVTYISYYSD